MKRVREFGDLCRLESVTGPLKGEVFPLARDRTSIGSDPSNELTIYDASIAEGHRLMTRREGVVVVKDLASPQGTFVNYIAVKKKILKNGDTLRIGECELVYRDGSRIARKKANLNAERHDVIEVLPAPLLHQPSLPPPQVTDVGRMARDLNALFKVANAINSQRDLESLQKGILQLLFEVVPADAGAIQIIDNVERRPTSTVSWKREGHLVPDLNVRHEMVLRTFWERSAVVADFSVTSRQTEKCFVFRWWPCKKPLASSTWFVLLLPKLLDATT